MKIKKAAIQWWESHCPDEWTEEKHCEEPTVNCLGPWEKELAKAVAKVVSKSFISTPIDPKVSLP